MSMDVWDFGTADDDPVERLVDGLGLASGERSRQEPAMIESVMAEARKPGAAGFLWAAVALRLLAGGAEPSANGTVAIWRRVAASHGPGAWFAAAGPDAKALYDAVIEQVLADHACTGLRPTMSEVLGRIAALPAPVAVAGVLDFTMGFFDNEESAALAPAFVEVVEAQAAARMGARGAPR
ncbi:hypothetical protein [Azospirillum brasilense]|uniref:Uncharacterized protein n=1 Tax=Azospirillum brasilense TaxID=192 RepID=A0A235HAN5_AZOBR|nr:hypothetical protein [Azospirillum brasilense]OYD82900.1 hypothetical protein CHT98_18600 [Azospirillum brasilense]